MLHIISFCLFEQFLRNTKFKKNYSRDRKNKDNKRTYSGKNERRFASSGKHI